MTFQTRVSTCGLLMVVLATPAFAQFSGFLEDYPPLEPLDGVANALVWRAPNLSGQYRAVYFEQPEVFLDPDSPYKGIQPDMVKALSDVLLDIVQTDAVERGRDVADEPGPDVMHARVALTNVYVKRRDRVYRPISSYSGFRLRAAIGRNLSLVEATIEVELLDGESNERLGVVIVQEGQRRVEELEVDEFVTSWSEIVSTIERLARVVQSHFGDLLVQR